MRGSLGERMSIQVFLGSTLSLERAKRIAPADYSDAYDWFIDHEGETGSRPYGANAPKDVCITLCAQRGIHKPGGNYCHALSITSTSTPFYNTDRIHRLEDGTWVMSYSEQRQNDGSRDTNTIYNEALHKCLHDGLPVGVFIKQSHGDFLCLGLAFVEHYDIETGAFLVHGPVTKETDNALSPIASESINIPAIEHTVIAYNGSIDRDLTDEIERALRTGKLDEAEKNLTPLIRAVRQHQYRETLFAAYQNRCAITGCCESNALQAERIVSYLGAASNRPSNGLCLRADIRQLFNRHLLSVDPEHLTVQVSRRLMQSEYRSLSGRSLLLPSDKKKRPSHRRLAAHYAAFQEQDGAF